MQDLVLVIVLVISSVTDLVYRKIYNLVLIPALLFALGYNFYVGSWKGLGLSILGMVIGVLILIWPFAKGGMGAGDVKLLAFVGALKGPQFVLYAAIGMGLTGGIIALIMWIRRIGIINTLSGFFNGIWTIITSGFTIIPFNNKERIMLPYGLAIALGTAGAWWWMR